MIRFLLFLFFTQSVCTYAQERLVIDSLKTRIERPDLHDTLKIMEHLEIATLFYHTNRDSCRYYSELALEFSKKTDFKRGQARALTNIALIKIENGEQDEAEDLLNESLQILNDLNDPEIELFIYANLGILHHYGTDYDIAVDYYLQSAEIAEKINARYDLIRAYLNIGDVFRQNDIYDEATKYLSRASRASKNDYPDIYGYSTSQIADIFRGEHALDSAKIYIYRVFEKIDSINSPQILSQIYSVRANILEEEEKYVEAYPDHLKSLAYAEQLGQDYAIAGCFCLLGNNASNRDQYEEAERYFERYAELSEGINNQYLDQECLMYWSLMEEARGDFKKSNELLYRYFAIKDSIYSAENRTMLTDLATKYEAAEKDAEIAKQKLRITQRTNQRNWFVLGVLGLILLSWFFFYRNRKNKILAASKIENLEKQQKLLALDYMVQGQEKERKRIAQDLHDGLGGLLASAKLQIQKIQKEIEKFTDLHLFDQAEKMINTAHTEVRRIAHDMMPGALIDLGLIDAVEDLIEKTRKEQDFIINFSKPEEEIYLGEVQSLNLYRIIQEILTNTVKHANASSVNISLQIEQQNLILNISDNGRGFNFEKAKAKNGIGLNSITSRVKYLEGKLHVDSKPETGTRYKVEVPLS